MKATITSKGQITIPVRIRQRLRLKAGDILDFDENSTMLVAKKQISKEEWNQGIQNFQRSWTDSDTDHPWTTLSSAEILDDLRGPASSF